MPPAGVALRGRCSGVGAAASLRGKKMTVEEAIERSQSHDEIVQCEFAGDSSDLMVVIDGLYDGNIDDRTENDGTIDVWGWTDAMEATAETEWRLSVTLSRIDG